MIKLTKYTLIAAVALTGLTRITLAATATVATNEVVAPELPPSAGAVGEDKWRLTVPLYIWAAGLEGNVRAAGRSANLDVSASDVMQASDFGFTAYLQLAKPNYGIYVSPLYMKLSGSGQAGPIKATDTVELWIVEFAAFYKFFAWEGKLPGSLTALAGGRYYSVHNELTLKDPLGNSNYVESKSLCDPIIGLRYEQRFTKRFHAWVQGDIGGFDITDSQSRFSWQVQPLLGYDFDMIVIHKPSTVFAGYRVLGIQKDIGGANNASYNLRMQGFVVGLNVVF